MQKSFTCSGLVIRRSNSGETDRFITLLTKEYGKLTCLAKGARRLQSTKSAALEPGNLVKVFLINRRSGAPLLTEAKLENEKINTCLDLKDYRKLSEFLEIINALFVEQEIESDVWQKILQTRILIGAKNNTNGQVKHNLRSIIVSLGFEDPDNTKHTTIAEYVSALADKKLNSFTFLKV